MSQPSNSLLSVTPFTLARKEQFLTLQYLLGLRSSPPSENMPLFNDLPGSSAKDVLFVCIDTEFTPDGRKLSSQEFQFGFCSLDMRDVLNLAKNAPTSQQEDRKQADLLKTYNFCVGSSKYCSQASPKFLFGQSETCCLKDIKAGITKLLPNDRNVILVTHDGQMDINFAQELEISFQPIYILDTQKVAQHPLQLARRIGLRGLLNMLQIKFQHMHIAGNDANFTLRALLLLGIWDSESEGVEVTVEQEELIVALRAVAQLRRPRSAVEHAVRAGSGSTK